MAEYGFRFQPGADQGLNGQTIGAGTGPGAAGATPQQAVKILSLRVPHALPTSAPINHTLITAPGSAAPGGNALTSLVQALLQSFRTVPPLGPPIGGPPTNVTGPPAGSVLGNIATAPTPSFRPGGEGALQIGQPPPAPPLFGSNQRPPEIRDPEMKDIIL